MLRGKLRSGDSEIRKISKRLKEYKEEKEGGTMEKIHNKGETTERR